jgi:type IV secretion system protein VirD4
MNEQPSSAANSAFVLLAALFALSTTVWCGAQLAARVLGAGHWLDATLHDATRAFLQFGDHLADPRHAWPAATARALPGPIGYWACTIGVFVLVSVVLISVANVLRTPSAGSPRRRRLGVDTQARFARQRELAPLIVPAAQAGRFVLGRVGRRLVATEERHSNPATGRTLTSRFLWRRVRQGDRSSVLVVGPTRCGKTANAIAGTLEWIGPAILSSVKSDLIGATLAQRARVGEVRVFDPTRSTDQPCAGWSPLRAADSLTGAQKAARADRRRAPARR